MISRIVLIVSVLSLAVAAQPAQTQWQSLFDGKALGQWKETPFTGHAAVRVENGAITLLAGNPMTGVTWSGAFPKSDYEIRFEAFRLAGGDFFASLTFPVGRFLRHLGPRRLGRRHRRHLQHRRLGRLRQRNPLVLQLRNCPLVCLPPAGHRGPHPGLDRRPARRQRRDQRPLHQPPVGDIKLSAPFGFASYNTTGGIRKIEYRPLPAKQQ